MIFRWIILRTMFIFMICIWRLFTSTEASTWTRTQSAWSSFPQYSGGASSATAWATEISRTACLGWHNDKIFTIIMIIITGMAKHSNFLKLVIDTVRESYKSEEYRARWDSDQWKMLHYLHCQILFIEDGFQIGQDRDCLHQHL